jgi:hypothetical protein
VVDDYAKGNISYSELAENISLGVESDADMLSRTCAKSFAYLLGRLFGDDDSLQILAKKGVIPLYLEKCLQAGNSVGMHKFDIGVLRLFGSVVVEPVVALNFGDTLSECDLLRCGILSNNQE